jgi:hypothetical protein
MLSKLSGKPAFLNRLQLQRPSKLDGNTTRTPRLSFAVPVLVGMLSLVGALMGGVLGNAMLESAKSADTLRKFVLTDIYQPYLLEGNRCLQYRSDLAMAFSQARYGAGAIMATLNMVDTKAGEARQEAIAKAFIGRLQAMEESLNKVYAKEAELKLCLAKVNSQIDLLAIALSKKTRTTEIIADQNVLKLALEQKHSKLDVPAVERMYGNTAKELTAIFKGLEGAVSGDAIKGQLVLSRIKRFVSELDDLFANRVQLHNEILAIETDTLSKLNTVYFEALDAKYAKSIWQMMF